MTAFRQQLDAFHAKLTLRAESVVREVVVQLGHSVIYRSPWGRWEEWGPRWQHQRPMPPYVPGLFRNSWDYGFGSSPTSSFHVQDEGGHDSFARISAVKTAPAFATHFIVNNTEYAMMMEYGYAFHNAPDPTPPGGMVRLAALEFHSIVGAALAGLK